MVLLIDNWLLYWQTTQGWKGSGNIKQLLLTFFPLYFNFLRINCISFNSLVCSVFNLTNINTSELRVGLFLFLVKYVLPGISSIQHGVTGLPAQFHAISIKDLKCIQYQLVQDLIKILAFFSVLDYIWCTLWVSFSFSQDIYANTIT